MTIIIKNKNLGKTTETYSNDKKCVEMIDYLKQYKESISFIKNIEKLDSFDSFDDHDFDFEFVEKKYNLPSGTIKELYKPLRNYIGFMNSYGLLGIKFKPMLVNYKGELIQQNFIIFLFSQLLDPTVIYREMLPIDCEIEYYIKEIRDYEQFV